MAPEEKQIIKIALIVVLTGVLWLFRRQIADWLIGNLRGGGPRPPSHPLPGDDGRILLRRRRREYAGRGTWFLIGLLALAALAGGVLRAQDHDITGTWQGTLHVAKDLRVVLKVSKADAGALKATMFSIDQGGQAIPAAITLQGTIVKITVAAIGGTYEGKLVNSDGTSITGTWSQGPNPVPLDLTLANDKTAWEIPAPPPPPKLIPADANPSFEVATIKPTQEGTKFSIHPTASGTLIATDASLAYLIKFAYQVHPRQITKAPAWLDTDKYDLTAKPNMEGQPSLPQMRMMVHISPREKGDARVRDHGGEGRPKADEERRQSERQSWLRRRACGNAGR